jgi:alkanesulfonate monooxygenase SsuD/methylene tetrahydromethanopterin reductase-like flavin-dependent oxidoreductase (luciferase family)
LRRDKSDATEAQGCFQRAIEVARKQSAKSLELRATMSLARLLAKEGDRDDARKMLADIYNWFTEMLFGTPKDAIERVGQYFNAGASRVTIDLRAPFDWDTLRGYVEEVLPAF